jgi:two-component system cell cycle response regulator
LETTDIKTRVTPLQELSLPKSSGQDCLVIIYTSDAHQLGKRYSLAEGPLLLGRGSDSTLILPNDSVSRRHARVESRGDAYFIVDLASTNGTYVNDEPVTDHPLRRGDQIKIGDTILKFLSGTDLESQYHETIYRMTIVDGLTGVHNKRYLTDTLDREIPRAQRHQRPLAMAMLDIDHFKQVNDTFGHLAGDHILKEIAQLLRSRLRPDDIVTRYGGEEFAIVLPETELEGAVQITDQLRTMIEAERFHFEDEYIRVTLSGGVCQLSAGATTHTFLNAADVQLYQAKRGGRNRICSP